MEPLAQASDLGRLGSWSAAAPPTHGRSWHPVRYITEAYHHGLASWMPGECISASSGSVVLHRTAADVRAARHRLQHARRHQQRGIRSAAHSATRNGQNGHRRATPRRVSILAIWSPGRKGRSKPQLSPRAWAVAPAGLPASLTSLASMIAACISAAASPLSSWRVRPPGRRKPRGRCQFFLATRSDQIAN